MVKRLRSCWCASWYVKAETKPWAKDLQCCASGAVYLLLEKIQQAQLTTRENYLQQVQQRSYFLKSLDLIFVWCNLNSLVAIRVTLARGLVGLTRLVFISVVSRKLFVIILVENAGVTSGVPDPNRVTIDSMSRAHERQISSSPYPIHDLSSDLWQRSHTTLELPVLT